MKWLLRNWENRAAITGCLYLTEAVEPGAEHAEMLPGDLDDVRSGVMVLDVSQQHISWHYRFELRDRSALSRCILRQEYQLLLGRLQQFILECR